MGQLNKTNFKTKYGASGSQFPDNTVGSISELIMRVFGEDLTDSFINSVDDLQGLTSTSGTNTYTIPGSITSYQSDFTVKAKFLIASSGYSTLNVNALGAKKIFKNPTTQAGNGDLIANQIYLLIYDSTLDSGSGGFLIIGSSSGGGGGSGDVVGPASATDNAIARFDTTTGKLLQNGVVTIGDTGLMAGVTGISLGAASVIDVNSGALNLGTVSATTVNLGTGAANTNINIGTAGTNTIQIGNSNSTVNILGTVLYENVTNLQVADKLITLNKGGAVSSASGSGLELEENAVVTGYFKTTGGRDGWLLKAPSISNDVSFLFTNITAGRSYTLPNASGTLAISASGNIALSAVGDISFTGLLPYANFVNGAALSVVGRSANTSGVQADITAGTDAHVLRRSGTTLGFGTIGDASIADLAYGKLTGTVPFYTLASGGTATGVNTFTSNLRNQLIHTGTWTATTTGDYHESFGGTFTNSTTSNDVISGYRFSPTLISNGTSQVQVAVDINPSFSGGTTPNNVALRVQGGPAVFGATSNVTYNGAIYAAAPTASRVALFGNVEITTNGAPGWTGVGIGAVGANRALILSGNGATTDNDAVTFTGPTYSANRAGVDLGIWNAALPSFNTAFQANSLAGFRFNSTWPTLTVPLNVMYGFDYNPGGTGNGVTHLAWRNTSGNILIGGTTITANTRVDVRGTGTGTNNILRLADSANTARFIATDSGNIYGTAGTTSMTDGFFYIPSAAGVPSGTPTAFSGRLPMYYDSTNNNFYIYNGAWKKVALT